ncbi:MAG: hypothetical protein KDK37_02710 [Leptospiraceae bacterium]|nr:hypothetical protein [Leptospiraceae bacterium]MCB1303156.1 hypothetical protein [Leptospiraceae bacterium]
MIRITTLVLIATQFSIFPLCKSASQPGYSVPDETMGVVEIYDSIPKQCNEVRGLKQSEVKAAHSEQELIDHYGITFIVRFQDKKSPVLYGTLYYQNPRKNLYCMALPDGRFASFSDSQIDTNRKNFIQEVCHPLQTCEIVKAP